MKWNHNKNQPQGQKDTREKRSFALPLALYLISFSYFAQLLVAYLSSS